MVIGKGVGNQRQRSLRWREERRSFPDGVIEGDYPKPYRPLLEITTFCSYNAPMQKFEWGEGKRQINAQKHLIDFADAVDIFQGDTVTVEDDRFDYGEQRFITLGLFSSLSI